MNNKTIKLSCSLDYLTNGKIGYSIDKDLLKKSIKDFNKQIKDNGCVLGELNHSSEEYISLTNASHKIHNVKIDDNLNCIADIEVLETPMGKVLNEMLNANNDVSIGLRGYIEQFINEEGEVEHTIKPITFDIVKL